MDRASEICGTWLVGGMLDRGKVLIGAGGNRCSCLVALAFRVRLTFLTRNINCSELEFELRNERSRLERVGRHQVPSC